MVEPVLSVVEPVETTDARWFGDQTALADGLAQPTDSQPLSVYVHVPFCSRRCGYCDFNTYAATDLGGGASRQAYADLVLAEIGLFDKAFKHPDEFGCGELAGQAWNAIQVPTVYFGGGTPTVLPARDLVKILTGIANTWELAVDAEITTEANPDSVTEQDIAVLAKGGFNRISFGMQSAVPHVLKTLDRTHDPEKIQEVIGWAKENGLKASLDLIYGTPGESIADWQHTVNAAIATGVDHISAYALTIAPNTKLGRQIANNQVAAPDNDDLADKYELADKLLSKAGLKWYEISNWARGGIGGNNASQHNLAYWHSADWLGIGPGAHSHLNGTRFWDVVHPRKWAELVLERKLPIAGLEQLNGAERALERIFLELRLETGMPLKKLLDYRSRLGIESEIYQILTSLVASGLISEYSMTSDSRIVLTRKGRLLADIVVHTLT